MNLEKLDEAIAWIEANPERHDQASWFERYDQTECGTTACLAGTIAILDGWRPDFAAKYSTSADYVVKDGMREYVASVARRVLDVRSMRDDELADEMFYEANDLADIKAIRDKVRDRIAAGER